MGKIYGSLGYEVEGKVDAPSWHDDDLQLGSANGKVDQSGPLTVVGTLVDRHTITPMPCVCFSIKLRCNGGGNTYESVVQG
jgi:hypothetical protein